MKKMIVLFALIGLSIAQVWSQEKEDRNFRIPLIGEKAPTFTAETTNGSLTFPDDFGRNWKILFSHPADFTPVCSSELMELANLQEEFAKKNVKIAIISTDELTNHLRWKKDLEGITYKGRPTPKIKFPLIDDNARVVSKLYGMIHAATNTTKDVRGVFIIDPDNIIQMIYFYPMSIGRNTEELLRTITALQATAADKNLATPADWKYGTDFLIKAPPVADQSTENVPDGYYKLAWFMWFQKVKEAKQ
jgi:peroxiredoxin 2/4